MRQVVVAALALALAASSARAEPPEAPRGPDSIVRYSDRAMGTLVHITLWGDDERLAAEGAAAVFDEFRRVDALMSSWRDGSDVARINAAAGGPPVEVDPEVLAVIQRAQAAARRTGGAFDITVGSFRGLWKFDEDRDGTLPAPDAVRARLPLVGWKGVRIDAKNSTVRLTRKGARITLGGVAKGHAVDRAVKILHDKGLVDFILQAGGDLYVSGRRGDRSWRVGIRDPRGAPDATFALAEIQDRTFSTSGDYERSVVKDGVRHHHILDPRTGFPAKASRSVTVMAPDAMTADIWSTALFVLGAEAGMPMVEKRPELEAVFVDADNRVRVSSGLKDRLQVLRPPTDGL